MTSHIYTRVQAKARARQLKAESDTPLSLAAALEIVAKDMGFRDWNTASARQRGRVEPGPQRFAGLAGSVGARWH